MMRFTVTARPHILATFSCAAPPADRQDIAFRQFDAVAFAGACDCVPLLLGLARWQVVDHFWFHGTNLRSSSIAGHSPVKVMARSSIVTNAAGLVVGNDRLSTSA